MSEVKKEKEYKEGKMVSIGRLELGSESTNRQLLIMRNIIQVQYGYGFNQSDLKCYLSQFPWYIPGPNLKMENIKLIKKEKEFVETYWQKKQKNALKNFMINYSTFLDTALSVLGVS